MVRLNKEMFREYDIRGYVDKDLNPEVMELMGKAYGTYIQDRGEREVIVGQDNRTSSPAYADALIRGLRSTGCDVIDIGVVTSPVFYFSRVHFGKDGGVMITASHNPPEFNGLKMAHGFGTIFGEEIQRIYLIAMAGEFKVSAEPGKLEKRDIYEPYFKMLEEKIKLDFAPRGRKLKVVVDCGNGTDSLFAPRAMKNWGVDLVEMYCESDGSFPNHIADPVKLESIAELRKRVVAEKADLGIAFDGDGDRVGVIDERGEVIWGDMLMILFWKEILQKFPGADAIVEVKCSQALWEEVERMGGKPQFYRTGHSFIKARMKEISAKFSGEMSGHMYFADEFYGFDDALYAAGRMLRLLSETDKPASSLLAHVPTWFSTPEVRVMTTDQEKTRIVETMVKFFKDGGYKVVDVDGARVLFGDGWGLVRQSNTQPALVVRCEAKTAARLEEIKTLFESQLRQFPSITHIDWTGKEG